MDSNKVSYSQEKINSNSGDIIKLISKDDKIFVFKSTVHGNKRFSRSIQKQLNFNKIFIINEQIKSAEILEINTDKENCGVVSILMPYYSGIVGSDYILKADHRYINKFTSYLTDLLNYEIKNSYETILDMEIFHDKLNEIIEKTSYNRTLSIHFDLAKNFLSKYNKKIEIITGNCHGDLTLSNIILNEAGIVLIDFLDTFVESPLQDVSKIIQDVLYLWSFRHISNSGKINAAILGRHIYNEVIYDIHKKYKKQVDLLTAFSLLRILPYIKDEVTFEWVNISLNKFWKSQNV